MGVLSMNKVKFRNYFSTVSGGFFWTSEYLWVRLKTFHFTEHKLMQIKREIVNYRLAALTVLIKESIE